MELRALCLVLESKAGLEEKQKKIMSYVDELQNEVTRAMRITPPTAELAEARRQLKRFQSTVDELDHFKLSHTLLTQKTKQLELDLKEKTVSCHFFLLIFLFFFIFMNSFFLTFRRPFPSCVFIPMCECVHFVSSRFSLCCSIF